MQAPRPLITFYVIAYNQEQFIQQAVDGALSQTWSPLEIVLSDDCSSDRTFEIIQEMAGRYSGPHTLVVNRNSENLGVGRHINRIVELSHGEFIVASAGDDVSDPERTCKMYARWRASRSAQLVYSNLIETDQRGDVLRARDFALENASLGGHELLEWGVLDHVQGRIPHVHGATFGYTRDLFSKFGPLADGVIFEEGVLNWRAECIGTVCLCREQLVRHRNHPQQLTNIYSVDGLRDALRRRGSFVRSRIAAAQQNILDTRLALERYGMESEIAGPAMAFAKERLRAAEVEFTALYARYPSRLCCVVKNIGEISRKPRAARFIAEAILPHVFTNAIRRAIANRRAHGSALGR